MRKSTIIFCRRGEEVLLAMKKRGFGVGKWNGYGGKIQDGESIEAGAVRELKEESGLSVQEKDLKRIAILHFYFENDYVFECHVFETKAWVGEPVETEEMRPHWFSISDQPYKEMWVADSKWIPIVLGGENIEAKIIFNKEGTTLKNFTYEPLVL